MGNICDQICLKPLALYLFLKGSIQIVSDMIDVIGGDLLFPCKLTDIYAVADIAGGNVCNGTLNFVILKGLADYIQKDQQIDGGPDQDQHAEEDLVGKGFQVKEQVNTAGGQNDIYRQKDHIGVGSAVRSRLLGEIILSFCNGFSNPAFFPQGPGLIAAVKP